jgi:molecular chaperone GrpE
LKAVSAQKNPNENSKEAAGAAIPAPTASAAGDPAASVGDAPLAEQVQKLLAEKQELTNTLIRRQADFENYRKRVEKERQHDRHRGAEHLVEKLLPVLDAFDRALAAEDDPAYVEYRKGFELTRRQLWEALAKAGLERIETAGKKFDPHLHHAIQQVETGDVPDSSVIDELQSGYMFHGRVLRPAMVRVAAHPASTSKAPN